MMYRWRGIISPPQTARPVMSATTRSRCACNKLLCINCSVRNYYESPYSRALNRTTRHGDIYSKRTPSNAYLVLLQFLAQLMMTIN